jgi:hypothetical protein
MCVLFWLAVLSATHDMTEGSTCVAVNQGPSLTEKVIAILKVNLWP